MVLWVGTLAGQPPVGGVASPSPIAQIALGDRDALSTMRGVCSVLVEHAGCDRATLTPVDGDAVQVTASRPGPTAATRTHSLISGPSALGHLEVGVADTNADALVESLLPTIVLVVQKALDQQALAAYQLNLERRVAERTAALTQARDELTGTVARLEEAQASREKLFHNISHEIRTPLALVLLLVDGVLTHHRAELTERAVGQLNAITVSTRKLVRLVDELLLLASGQERNLVVQPEPVELRDALPELLAGWVLAAQEAGLTLTVQIDADGPVMADPAALERVLANLTSNAIKFTPRGGHVAVTVTRHTSHTELAVTDDGPGIDPGFRSRIFERFEQGEAGRRLRSGSGIGLAIARELVRAHGGELEAHDNPAGRGSRFVAELPCILPPPATPAVPAGAPLPAPGRSLRSSSTGPAVGLGASFFAPPSVDPAATADRLARGWGMTAVTGRPSPPPVSPMSRCLWQARTRSSCSSRSPSPASARRSFATSPPASPPTAT